MVLQALRERLTGVLAFTILGILIIPFALVGVNQYFTSSDSNIVAQINDTDITSTDFNRNFSDYRRRMQSVLGDNYDPLEFDKLSVRRHFLDNLIDEELITQAANDMQLDVDDQTLAEQIRNIPAFQIEGQFNADLFESRVRGQGLSPLAFERRLRTQFVVNQLPRNITLSSIATEAELSKFVALRDQSRTFSAVLVPAVVPATPADFSEQEITAWYQSHVNDYQSEERVIIDYVELDAAALPAGLPPEEDFLRSQYKNQKARFVTPEQRRVAHILFAFPSDADEATKETAKQTAEEMIRRTRAGEDFSALAKEYSQDEGSASEGGDLGWVEPGVMVKAFEDAMYELSMAKPVSEPVQTAFGWHVIKLLEIRPASGMSFEEARPLLTKEYEEDQASRAFLEQADQLVDLIYEDPTTLDSAALVMNLKVKQAGPFTRAGGQGVAANPEVITAAFSDLVLLQGSVSDPVNIDDDRLVMIKLNKHLPVALKPLAEVHDAIVATLGGNLARASAQTQANDMLAALQGGGSTLPALATEAGLEFSQHKAIKRDALIPDVLLVQEIFRLPVPAGNDTDWSVLPTSNGFAVVGLESVLNGKLAAGDVLAQQQYQRILANGRASEEAFALIRQLRNAADITIHEGRVQ